MQVVQKELNRNAPRFSGSPDRVIDPHNVIAQLLLISHRSSPKDILKYLLGPTPARTGMDGSSRWIQDALR
jgi:hypothetical protein